MLYCLSIGSCDLLDVGSLLLQTSKSPPLSAWVGLTASPLKRNPHSPRGAATQRGRMRPMGLTHLARDALLLRNDDVFLPQGLLQPLRCQNRLAGLQSRWNAEKADADTAGAAALPSSPCQVPTPVRSTGQSLSSACRTSEAKPNSPNMKETIEVTGEKTQPPHQTTNSASHFSHELLTAPLLPQRTDLLGPAQRKHWTPSSAQSESAPHQESSLHPAPSSLHPPSPAAADSPNLQQDLLIHLSPAQPPRG